MSAPEIVPLTTGKLTGAVYTFANVGDELETHKHSNDDKHITLVMRGAVRVVSSLYGTRDFPAGSILQFAPDEEHSIAALEPNTRITNIIY